MPSSGRAIQTCALALALFLRAPLPACAESSRPVALAEEPERAEWAGKLRFQGGLALSDPDPGFGELSDLRILDGGNRFLAVTDRGFSVTGRLVHDEAGWLIAARDLIVKPLPDLGPWPLDKLRRDAEALALLPGGDVAVAFELRHRVVVYPPDFAGAPRQMPLPPGLDRLRLNSGIEALAAFPDGTLVAIGEAGDADGRHQGWLWRGGSWRGFTYRAVLPFQPTGAAALPDGGLLVLERRASWFGGLGARVARVPAGALVEGADIAGAEVGRIDPPQIMENFEGIDVVAGPDGRLFVYLISDDNQEPLFRTVLLKFELPPD